MTHGVLKHLLMKKQVFRNVLNGKKLSGVSEAPAAFIFRIQEVQDL